jgi:hypothetical protein
MVLLTPLRAGLLIGTLHVVVGGLDARAQAPVPPPSEISLETLALLQLPRSFPQACRSGQAFWVIDTFVVDRSAALGRGRFEYSAVMGADAACIEGGRLKELNAYSGTLVLEVERPSLYWIVARADAQRVSTTVVPESAWNSHAAAALAAAHPPPPDDLVMKLAERQHILSRGGLLINMCGIRAFNLVNEAGFVRVRSARAGTPDQWRYFLTLKGPATCGEKSASGGTIPYEADVRLDLARTTTGTWTVTSSAVSLPK